MFNVLTRLIGPKAGTALTGDTLTAHMDLEASRGDTLLLLNKPCSLMCPFVRTSYLAAQT
ncbi:hypothetical protein GCM10007385_25040 [Tateyamaria omphalii]|nr:hypothetical protein GCM10007385_25040 [Tateyamaria omphalii]